MVEPKVPAGEVAISSTIESGGRSRMRTIRVIVGPVLPARSDGAV